MIAAFSFLTCFGTGRAPDARTARWFGVVGAAIGLVLGAFWVALRDVLSPFVAAVLVVALDALLTGMLHLDGLADSADGLCAPMERERRLVVMRTPDVGAFGVVVVVLAVLLQAGALAAVAPNAWLLVGLWCAARAGAALVMATLPYARPDGLARAFVADGAHRGIVLASAASVAGGVAAALAWDPQGAIAVAAALAAGAVIAAFARYRLGGFTGDVLGAVIVVAQTAGLVVASGLGAAR